MKPYIREILTIAGLDVVEYAALWGGSASYDDYPNHKGDGELFYQFARNQFNVKFLNNFLPAIDRQIEYVKVYKECFNDYTKEIDDLAALKQTVKARIENIENGHFDKRPVSI